MGIHPTRSLRALVRTQTPGGASSGFPDKTARQQPHANAVPGVGPCRPAASPSPWLLRGSLRLRDWLAAATPRTDGLAPGALEACQRRPMAAATGTASGRPIDPCLRGRLGDRSPKRTAAGGRSGCIDGWSGRPACARAWALFGRPPTAGRGQQRAQAAQAPGGRPDTGPVGESPSLPDGPATPCRTWRT